MPSCPGVLPVIAHAQAGTVIGGVMLARSPHIPRRIRAWMFGVSAAKSRNRSWGVAQSSPMTATRGVSVMCGPFVLVTQAGARRAPAHMLPMAPCHRAHDLRACAPVKQLRRTLVWQAALWAGFGLVLVIAPGWLIETVFDQPALGEEAWLRVSGVMAIALAGMMVLVSHRVDDLWWWSWTFVILGVASGTILALNALVGVPASAPSWPWWLLAGVNAGFALIELTALARIGIERPPG